jgi:HTH-type transcriptional regulator/antitoxin HigA
MLDAKGRPVIGLTLRHDRIDGFWFTVMHELSHASLHYGELLKGRGAFIDDMEIKSQDQYEIEADQLARNSLVPEKFISDTHWANDTSLDAITSIAAQARVHVSIVAGRWQKDHNNYKKFSRLIERNTVRPMFPAAGDFCE